MWTGGKPPPAPPSATPLPTTQYRSEQRATELDQLRQRGLAKLLNKHFTNVAQSLAQERAAADAALRDLEARKAAGLKDWGEGGERLSMYDQKFLELQQKKEECKRKERETLLLYQRYVDRFGSTGAVTAPRSPARVADASSATMNKKIGDMTDSTPTKVPYLAGQIESMLSRGSGVDKAVAGMNQRERIAYLRALEGGKGTDPLSTPGHHPKLNKDGTPCPNLVPVDEDTPAKSYLTSTTTSTDAKLDPPGEDVYHDLDEDIRSIVSELTSAELSDAERVLVEFLKTETAAIRKLLDNEEATVISQRTSYSNEVNSMSAKAADDAEDMVAKMEQMLKDFQTDAEKTEEEVARRTPRKLETSNPDEEWMIYWDESVKKEYYYEVRSNTAQWHKPASALQTEDPPDENGDDDTVVVVDYTRVSSSRSISMTYDDVMPMDDVPRQSRRDLYRKMRRRRRNRRLLFLAFLTVSILGAGLYVNRFHHEETKSTLAEVLGSTELADNVIHTIEEYLPDAVTGRSERIEKQTRKERARRAAEQKAREEKALQEQREREQRERELRGSNNDTIKRPLKTWLTYNPHFFLANSKRGQN